jgi:cell division protein FtsL
MTQGAEQRTAAHNKCIAASGAGRRYNQQFYKARQWFSGLDKQLSTLVVKFNFIFSISIVYVQTEY